MKPFKHIVRDAKRKEGQRLKEQEAANGLSSAAGSQKWVLNDRPCGECKHFFKQSAFGTLGGCRKKLMGVLSDKPVSSKEGECCFENK